MSSRTLCISAAFAFAFACGKPNPVTVDNGTENCTNGVDDNSDGKADCADPTCFADASCAVRLERCDNEMDDNGDGLIDCADHQCEGQSCGYECVCHNGVATDAPTGGGTGTDGGPTGGGTNEFDAGGGTGTTGGGTATGGGSATGGGAASTGGGSATGGGTATLENCANGVDDNGDGKIDCAESYCNGRMCGANSYCVGVECWVDTSQGGGTGTTGGGTATTGGGSATGGGTASTGGGSATGGGTASTGGGTAVGGGVGTIGGGVGTIGGGVGTIGGGTGTTGGGSATGGGTATGGGSATGGGTATGGGSATGGGTADAGTTWTCDPDFYAADDGCDCGCGIPDPDCTSALQGYCDFCETGSCGYASSCANIDPNNNSTCVSSTPTWQCDPDYYDEGFFGYCDCGCGIVDPDCYDSTSSSCDDDACTGSSQPGPNYNAVCVP